jgi:hypothetical protein
MFGPRTVTYLLLLTFSLFVPVAPAADPVKPAPKPMSASATKPATLESSKVIVTGQVTTGIWPPIDPAAPPVTPPLGPPIAYTKSLGLTLFLLVGSGSDKTLLVGHIPTTTLIDFQRRYVSNWGWSQGVKSPTFAFAGRLTTEDEPGLFPGGVAPILNDVPAFTLGEKKRVVLVIDGATEITRFNQAKFPLDGTAAVEGPPACGKNDLKLTSTESLAIRNGTLPVVVTGKKYDAASGTLGAALVRAAGTMVTDDGTVRLKDATVKVIKN